MEKINSYTEGYNKGYFKALLDMQSCIDSFNHSPYVSRGNQKYNAVKSLLNILLHDRLSRDKFMKYTTHSIYYVLSPDFKFINIKIDPREECE